MYCDVECVCLLFACRWSYSRNSSIESNPEFLVTVRFRVCTESSARQNIKKNAETATNRPRTTNERPTSRSKAICHIFLMFSLQPRWLYGVFGLSRLQPLRAPYYTLNIPFYPLHCTQSCSAERTVQYEECESLPYLCAATVLYTFTTNNKKTRTWDVVLANRIDFY